jgi:hypothetical protein
VLHDLLHTDLVFCIVECDFHPNATLGHSPVSASFAKLTELAAMT